MALLLPCVLYLFVCNSVNARREHMNQELIRDAHAEGILQQSMSSITDIRSSSGSAITDTEPTTRVKGKQAGGDFQKLHETYFANPKYFTGFGGVGKRENQYVRTYFTDVWTLTSKQDNVVSSVEEVLNTKDMEREDSKEKAGVFIKGFDADSTSAHFPKANVAGERELGLPLAMRYRDVKGWEKFGIYPKKSQPNQGAKGAMYSKEEALYTIKSTYNDYTSGLEEYAAFPGYCKNPWYKLGLGRDCNMEGEKHPYPSMYIDCQTIAVNAGVHNMTFPDVSEGFQCKVYNTPYLGRTAMAKQFAFKIFFVYNHDTESNDIVVRMDPEKARQTKHRGDTLLMLLISQAIQPSFMVG